MEVTKYYLPVILIASSSFVSSAQTLIAMNEIEYDQNAVTHRIANASSSKNDFDFLVGKWNILNRKLKSRLNNSNEWIEFDATHEMHKVLNGAGNVESIHAGIDGKPFEGMAVRLFDPVTKLWSIYRADSNSGTMDKPVVGSFEGKIGTFYGKDSCNGKAVIVQFKWDATDPGKPVWSQAFSADNGATWEWNWFMYFSGKDGHVSQNVSANQNIKLIELRNYILKPGQRENFTSLFEDNFIIPQQEAGSYTLGEYKVKSLENNFFWIRGFTDMASRNKALNEFYHGEIWKKHRSAANSMIINNDNVNLLRPLSFDTNTNSNVTGFNTNWFGQKKGIAVIDFYISNTKLDKLIAFVKSQYHSILNNVAIHNTSFWVSETAVNDFPGLPLFQDKNLLVQITFYKDEFEYQEKMKLVDANMSDAQKIDMADLVTLKNTLIIYPTERSFSIP